MDVRDRVDPAYLPMLQARAENPIDWSDPAAVRERNRAAFPPPPVPDGVDFEDHEAPGPEGAPPVVVRLYRPAGVTGQLPCVYWVHGGGYMGGTYDSANDTAGQWVLDLGCAVASVEYRLAPENPYPAPLDDCYAGLKWLIDNHERLGVDASNVMIGGASAGGGLCAALALLVRDRGELSVTHQVLIYPMIDDRRTTASSQWETWIWTRESNEIGWRAYLGDLFGRDDVPAYAAPSRATDLENLPPAYIAVGTLDLFLDEDLDYGRRLIDAGVPAELHVYPGAPHGFDAARLGGDAGLGARARADTTEYLRRALAVTTPVELAL